VPQGLDQPHTEKVAGR